MKLIFLGTPAFSVPTLRALARAGHTVAAVITQPDRPRGRGLKLSPPAAKEAAIALGLTVIQPETVSSPPALDEIRTLMPEAAVVVAYGRILKREFLDLPPLGCINLHPSLLPRHRGPTPIQSAIMRGDERTGVTTMLLDEGMDTGDILLQREVEISPDETAGGLHDRLADIGAELIVETVEALGNGTAVPVPQDESMATTTRKLSKEYSIIDWNRSHEDIRNLTRALSPSPGCRTKLEARFIKIWKVAPAQGSFEKAGPGVVLKARNDELIVQSGGDALRIVELQPPGGRRMSAGEFMRGHAIREGTVLGK